MGHGFSHVGVSTHNMEGTIHFYTEVLAFPLVADEMIRIDGGGSLRQASFQVGEGQYMVFMEATGIPGISGDYDTGINRGLGVPAGMYHVSLKVPSLDALTAWHEKLEKYGVEVSRVIDLATAKSVFFLDPNGLQLELSCQVRPFNESDLHRQSVAGIVLQS